MRCSGSSTPSSRAFKPLDDRRERVLLDQVQQPLFGFEVVIKPGQRHAARARQIAHGSAFVSLLAEYFGGMSKDLRQATVVAGGRSGRGAMRAARTFALLSKDSP